MKISKLHYISQETEGKTHAALVREACIAGVEWVQLRLKHKSYEEALSIAQEVRKICSDHSVTMIVNDHVAIAKEVKADGVHLGKEDMSPMKAREILGDSFIIGGTANTIADIRILKEAKVNYIGLGPYRFTTTKENLSPVLGLEGYRGIVEYCSEENIVLPIIAIGGILEEDVTDLLEAGLYGIAVSALINKASDKKGMVESLNGKIEKFYSVV